MATLVLAVAGLVLVGSAPASAASSCTESDGTATVVLDAAVSGGSTVLSQDAASRLTVDGTVCGSTLPTVIGLQVAGDAPAQTVRLDQNGAGGMFPCSVSVAGALRATDVVEVDGASNESLWAGSTGAGSGIDLGSCDSAGTITGLGGVRLVAGAGTLTLSAAGGPGLAGPLGVPAVLEVADHSSQTLLPGAAANSIDFSRISSALTVNVSGGPLGAMANQSATTADGAVDTFAGFDSSRPVALIGSSSAATTFYAGLAPDAYEGSGRGTDILDFSGITNGAASSLRLCVAAISGCSVGAAQVGGVGETFSGIADFVGLSAGHTTFVSSGVGGHRFSGAGAGNVVDATPAGPGAVIDAGAGLVAAAGSASPDEFSSVSSFTGAAAGATTFVAGAASETFADPGAAGGDVVDFSHVPTAVGAPLTINVSGAQVAELGDHRAAVGGATYDFASGGAGITNLIGAASGSTVFDLGPSGGYTVSGLDTGNLLSVEAAGSGVRMDAASGAITGLSSGGLDTVRGLSTFTTYVGSDAGPTTFVAGPTDTTFLSASSGNTVDFSRLNSPVTVNVSGGPAGGVASGSAASTANTYSFASFANSRTTFVGSASAATTFDAGPVPDTYTAGAGGGTLDFSHSQGSPLRICVVAASGCAAGQAILGTTSAGFSGVSTLIGLPGGNTTFVSGDGAGYTFAGSGTGNLLDLRAAAAPVVDLAAGRISGLDSPGLDTFSGIQGFDVGLRARPPADATVGDSSSQLVDGTGSSLPVVLAVDAGTTNAACSIDGSGAVVFAHVGTCVLDASQAGDGTFAAAAPLTEAFQIAEGASAIALSVAPDALTAAVRPLGPDGPVPTGTVSFTVDGVAAGGPVALDSHGVATLSFTLATGSDHVVVASYSGDTDLAASSGSVDRKDPIVTAHVSSEHARSAYGWYRSPVTVSFTCAVQGSPLVGPCPDAVLLSADGVGQSASGSVDAADGGHGTASVGGIDIDQVAPVVTVLGVADGARYAARAPRARCVGVDVLSGSLGCSVGSVVRATAAGWTVSYRGVSSDRAGNVGRAWGSYVVARYGVAGAAYSNGHWLVGLHHRYLVRAVSRIRPTLLGPVPGNQRPVGHRTAFQRTGTVRGLPMWSATIRITDPMRRHATWSYGVTTGGTVHLVRVRLIR